MAIVTKSGARKPLADNSPSFSWRAAFSGLPNDARYRLTVNNETHSFSLEMNVKETINFIATVASFETFVYGKNGKYTDKRTTAEKLRALADKLEE